MRSPLRRLVKWAERVWPCLSRLLFKFFNSADSKWSYCHQKPEAEWFSPDIHTGRWCPLYWGTLSVSCNFISKIFVLKCLQCILWSIMEKYIYKSLISFVNLDLDIYLINIYRCLVGLTDPLRHQTNFWKSTLQTLVSSPWVLVMLYSGKGRVHFFFQK